MYSGADCASTGSTLKGLILKPDHWRAHQTSDDIKDCIVEGICLGGNDTYAQCKYGHLGPMCTLCIDNWFKTIDEGCSECESLSVRFFIAAAGVLVAVVVLLFLLKKLHSYMSPRTEERAKTVLKVLFVSSQILVEFEVSGAGEACRSLVQRVYRGLFSSDCSVFDANYLSFRHQCADCS